MAGDGITSSDLRDARGLKIGITDSQGEPLEYLDICFEMLLVLHSVGLELVIQLLKCPLFRLMAVRVTIREIGNEMNFYDCGCSVGE